MKRILYTFILCFLIKLSFAQEQFVSKYNTLAHELVAEEQLAADTTNTAPVKIQHYQKLLDSIIDACKIVLPKYDHEFKEAEALQTFTSIDSILYSFGFYVCVYVNYLSDALDPVNTIEKSRKEQNCRIYKDKIAYRNKFIKETTIAHKMDCDISCIIYYSVAQVMNYPVFMVEVPDHGFVRWRNNDSTYYNWDTNAAMSVSNDCYKYECIKGLRTGFNDNNEKAMNFLTDMDSKQIKAYRLPFTGLIYQERKKYADAERLYIQAMSMRKNNIYAMYFLAYMYMYDSTYNDASYHSKSYQLANQAFALLPDYKPGKGTVNAITEACGCAEALVGDFAGAIRLVKNSTRNKKLIKGFKRGKRCWEIVNGN